MMCLPLLHSVRLSFRWAITIFTQSHTPGRHFSRNPFVFMAVVIHKYTIKHCYSWILLKLYNYILIHSRYLYLWNLTNHDKKLCLVHLFFVTNTFRPLHTDNNNIHKRNIVLLCCCWHEFHRLHLIHSEKFSSETLVTNVFVLFFSKQALICWQHVHYNITNHQASRGKKKTAVTFSGMFFFPTTVLIDVN